MDVLTNPVAKHGERAWRGRAPWWCVALASGWACASACVPDVDIDESVVVGTRILAVRALPAEARPGQAVTYEALVATTEASTATLVWYQCAQRPPLSEVGSVASACLVLQDDVVAAVGEGDQIATTMPADACRRFGPEPPPTSPGEPAGRPADPDTTGGYRFPLVLFAPQTLARTTFQHRIACGVAGVTQAEAIAYRNTYRANTHPAVPTVGLELKSGETLTADVDGVFRVPSVSTVTVSVSWPTCEDTATCGDGFCGPDETTANCALDCGPDALGCGGREPYVVWDAAARALVPRREAFRVSFHSDAPGFADERLGVVGDEDAVQGVDTSYTPQRAGDAQLWVVVRDDRGGVSWESLRLRVE